jgi:hypothetical protein
VQPTAVEVEERQIKGNNNQPEEKPIKEEEV